MIARYCKHKRRVDSSEHRYCSFQLNSLRVFGKIAAMEDNVCSRAKRREIGTMRVGDDEHPYPAPCSVRVQSSSD
jgi:hypothetical protein